MTAGHLVARLHAAFYCHINLDPLEHAGCEIITRSELAFLFIEQFIQAFTLLFQLLGKHFHLLICLFIFETDLGPLLALELFKI